MERVVDMAIHSQRSFRSLWILKENVAVFGLSAFLVLLHQHSCFDRQLGLLSLGGSVDRDGTEPNLFDLIVGRGGTCP